MVSRSDTAALSYVTVHLGILVFMDMISPGMVSTKSYYFEYVVNICPRLDLVFCLVWIAFVCLSETEVFTTSCCSGAGFFIGACWVSSSCTSAYTCYYVSMSFSLVMRPWYNGEMNAVAGSCCSECINTYFFNFTNPHMACQYLSGTIFPPGPLIVVK